MKYQIFITVAIYIALLLSCSSKSGSSAPSGAKESSTESKEAKAMLQGIWIDAETEEVSFRAVGDSIFYPDTISQPTFFSDY